MNSLLNNISWKFIKEGTEPSLRSYLQSISETLNAINPRSTTDYRRLEIAKQHLLEVRRNVKRLEEKVQVLEEQVKVLEEEKKVLEELKEKGK